MNIENSAKKIFEVIYPMPLAVKSLVILTAASYLFNPCAFAQKQAIDSSVQRFKALPFTSSANITGDGKYAAIATVDRGNITLKLQAIKGSWKQEISHCKINWTLANRGRTAIFIKNIDTLCLLKLGGKNSKKIPHVSSFSVDPKDGKWLVYQRDDNRDTLFVCDLETGNNQYFKQILTYRFAASAALFMEHLTIDKKKEILWANLEHKTLRSIWQGESFSNPIFSTDGTAAAFSVIGNKPLAQKIWYYHAGQQSAIEAVSIDTISSEDRALFSVTLKAFNKTGDRFFFASNERSRKSQKDSSLAKVDIYGYKDPLLQSMQLIEAKKNKSTFWEYYIPKHSVKRLTSDNEILLSPIDNKHDLNYVLLEETGKGDAEDEWNWNPEARERVFLLSTLTGEKRLLGSNKKPAIVRSYKLSPAGKYVVYFDDRTFDYFSYNVATGENVDLTKDIKGQWVFDDDLDNPDSLQHFCGIGAWLKDDAAALLKSRSDIFQVDLKGNRPLVNLTNGWGEIHHITFTTLKVEDALNLEAINPSAELTLKAFNNNTKDIGYCRIALGKPNNPIVEKWIPSYESAVVRPAHAETYLFKLESAEKAPNWFASTDLKNFQSLTDVHPESGINWLTDTLVMYPTLNGGTTQGILYKPEKFDPSKKYPVIFYYYERMSDNLHRFPIPSPENGQEINISNYVSNGYLVFLPDIRFEIGHPGQSAFNSIVGAAKFLRRYHWVDTARMGLMGHSFGGFETNYVITHCNLFKAAVSSAGMTDFVSAYGSILADGTSRQHQYELYRDRIGATLWQHPELYIENSPVFLADKVTTPVLMVANHQDGDVPSEQGFEFFTALRRLQKKAWLLQYDHGSHGLFDPADDKDFSIRMQQFFDYYLKGTPPPLWMTEGIPATQKQIETGFELDNSGKQP